MFREKTAQKLFVENFHYSSSDITNSYRYDNSQLEHPTRYRGRSISRHSRVNKNNKTSQNRYHSNSSDCYIFEPNTTPQKSWSRREKWRKTAASPFSRKCIHITGFSGTTSLLPFHLHIQANYTPWITQQLVTALHQQRDRIRAVIYCRRFGTADIFNELLTTDVLIIRADKHLLPHRRNNKPWIRAQLAQVQTQRPRRTEFAASGF